MDIRELDVFCTGGAGTLGKAIAARRSKEGWKGKLTVYSTDTHKHDRMRKDFPDVNYVQGDIRDPVTLYNAMVGHDVALHCAAVKVIPVSEFQSIDTYKVNVQGSLNVCETAVRAGVKDVLGISTDKACLAWHSPVLLEDGTTALIGDMVNSKMECKVQSYVQYPFDTKIEGRRVTGWFKNKVNGRQMYSVSYEGAPYMGSVAYHVLVTEDHKFLVQKDGFLDWMEAKDLEASGANLVTAEWDFNYLQEALLVGTMLGDANISKNDGNTRPRLRMAQAEKEKEWLVIKAKALSIGKERLHVQRGAGTRQDTITANSPTSAGLLKYFDAFYRDGKKVVPFPLVEKALQSEHRRPVFLATWYLDDGCTTDNLARIATHGFSESEVTELAKRLTRYGFESYSYCVTVSEKEYYELRFTKKGSERLYKEIAGFVPESMSRKIPDIYKVGYVSDSWDLGNTIQYKAKPIVKLVGKNKTGDVYCLAVEQSENFIVNNMILHNCHPVNAYGATKYMMEKTFQEYARAGHATQFHLVRYGNVLESNGSVIEAWKASLARKEPIKITNPEMTRFWLSPSQAVDYVVRSLTLASGHIYVPRAPALSIGNLAKYALGEENFTWQKVDIRPGEKFHEELLTAEEGWFALPCPGYFDLSPTTSPRKTFSQSPYTSDIAPELTREELAELLANV